MCDSRYMCVFNDLSVVKLYLFLQHHGGEDAYEVLLVA